MKSFILSVWFIGSLGLTLTNDNLPDDPYMSYLHFPHLHVYGKFVVNAATINNLVSNFDMEHFLSHDAFSVFEGGKGMWNPKGTNEFMLKDTYVTNVCYADGKCTSNKNEDTISGKSVTDGGYGSFAKMADIDPQGQVVPEIWALKIKIPGFFEADFIHTPLRSFWARQVNIPGDMGKGGFYQTVLRNIKWEENKSPFIKQIQQVMRKLPSKELSIKLYLDKFNMNATSPNFTQGRLIGTIGVSGPNAPTVCTWGRFMLSNVYKRFNTALFVIDKTQKKLIVELENSIPLDNNGFPIPIKGHKWYIAYPKTEKKTVNCSTDFLVIGDVNLTDKDWFEKFAGIKWFSLTDQQIVDLESTPLLLVTFFGTYNKHNTSNCRHVLLQEPSDGIHIQPYHNWVHRKDAGEHIRQKVFVTKFGKPLANAKIDLIDTPKIYDAPGAEKSYLNCGFPKLPLPNTSIRTKKDGIAEIIMEAIDPKNIRRIIDGQSYAHHFGVNGSELQKKHQKLIGMSTQESTGMVGDFMFLTRIYDNYTVSKTVTWSDHIYPIFHQYAYLFPVMRSSTFNMDSYFDVVSHRGITSLSIGLPVTHPSYMPVTRDLSKRKRKMILDWLAHENPPIGDVTKLISVSYLKELIHAAIEIIHSSIPVYFTTLWSLKIDHNIEIQNILRKLIEQEILHLGLMNNILTAIGGKIRSSLYSTLFLAYPSKLPNGIHPSILMSLERFSKSFLRDVLIEMRRPDYGILDVGFRKILFDQEVSYRSLCVNKSSFTKTNTNCDSNEHRLAYKYHLSYCRGAMKQYLSKSLENFNTVEANQYENSQDKDFFKYRSSVGKFYNHILVVIAKLTDCGTNKTLFFPKSETQVFSDLFADINSTDYSYLRLFKKHVFKIDNYFDVIKAMRLILNGNQGITPCNPRAVSDKQSQDFIKNDSSFRVNDFSQYAMLMAILKGRTPVAGTSPYNLDQWPELKEGDEKYIKKICDGKTYEFDGKEIPFDKRAVWPIISNPTSFSSTSSTVSRFSKLFSILYTSFLSSFIELFRFQYNVNNLKPVKTYQMSVLRKTQTFLSAAEHYGRKLVELPLNASGNPDIGPNAAPLYKYYLISPSNINNNLNKINILMKFNFNLTAVKEFMKPETKKTIHSYFRPVDVFDPPSDKIETDDPIESILDPIESILEPNEDPLTLAMKKKQNNIFYMTWSDLENDLDPTLKNVQNKNGNESDENNIRKGEELRTEEDGFLLRIDSLH